MNEQGEMTPYDAGQREGFRRALEGEEPWWTIPGNPKGEYRGSRQTRPMLGLATTFEIIQELAARTEVQMAQDEKKLDLGYRTVDGGGEDLLRKVVEEQGQIVRLNGR